MLAAEENGVLDPDCFVKSPYVAGYENRGNLFDNKDYFLDESTNFEGSLRLHSFEGCVDQNDRLSFIQLTLRDTLT